MAIQSSMVQGGVPRTVYTVHVGPSPDAVEKEKRPKSQTKFGDSSLLGKEAVWVQAPSPGLQGKAGSGPLRPLICNWRNPSVRGGCL